MKIGSTEISAIKVGSTTINKVIRDGILYYLTWPAEYLAVYNSFTTKPSPEIANAQATMVKTLVDGGIWAKRDLFYMFAQTTNTASEALKNWKNPGTYDATLAFGSGGSDPTFTALEGFTGNVTNKSYIRTNWNPYSNGVNYLEQNHDVAIGIATNSTTDAYDYGVYSNSVQSQGVSCNISVGGTIGYFYDYGQYKGATRSTTIGHWYLNRLNNTLSIYQNNAKTSYTAATTNTIASGEMYILARNRAGVGAASYSDKQVRWFAGGGSLTDAEIEIETQAVDDYLHIIGKDIYPYAPQNDLLLTCTKNTGQTTQFDIWGIANTAPIIINWGDGTNVAVVSDNTMKTYSHAYITDGPHTIKITHANSILGLRFNHDVASSIGGDIAAFSVCQNIETLQFRNEFPSTAWYGSINNLSLTIKSLWIADNDYVNGIITPFVNLVYLTLGGTNLMSISGNLDNATHLTNLAYGTSTGITITMNVTGNSSIAYIDSYAPNSYLNGDVTECINLVHICVGTPNEWTGTLVSPNYNYIDNYGGSSMTLDVTNKPQLWKLSSYNNNNTITGTLNNSPLLEQVALNGNITVTRPTRFNVFPKLVFFSSIWAYTSAEVNQLLADLVADKDLAGIANTSRVISLNYSSSGAPTGQGITDAAYLRTYHSPNGNTSYPVWTINTN